MRLSGEPGEWISRHGKPAEIVGPRGLPSHELEDGTFTVHEMVVTHNSYEHGRMMFGRNYRKDSIQAPDGLVPMHDDSPHLWRPLIYRWSMNPDNLHIQGWWTLGSQTELAWRYGLSEVYVWIEAILAEEEVVTMEDADERADALLMSCLTPQQRIEYAARGDFRVRGAKSGNTYRIRPGNGLEAIDPTTGETVVSYCLHTENWMPTSDIALATKFALEDEQLEDDVMAGARATLCDSRSEAKPEEITAHKIENLWQMV